MDNNKLPTVRISGGNREETVSAVAGEFPMTVFLNDVELVTLLCTPSNLDDLAVGFLFAEGFLKSRDEIKNITVNERAGIVRVRRTGEFDLSRELLFKRLITSACGRGAAFYSTSDAQNLGKIDSAVSVSVDEIFDLLNKFNQCSELFKATGGVHSRRERTCLSRLPLARWASGQTRCPSHRRVRHDLVRRARIQAGTP